MTSIDDLHDRAMDQVEAALGAVASSDYERSHAHFKEAYEIELQAAALVKRRFDLEPTRSLVLQSAAGIAYRLGLPREAERLIWSALDGDAPPNVMEDLRSLLERCELLSSNGDQLLRKCDLDLAVDGEAVSEGFTEYKPFAERVEVLQKLYQRNQERRLGLPYRESGQPTKEILKQSQMTMSLTRLGSYRATLRFGSFKETLFPELDAPAFAAASENIEDLARLIEAFSKGSTGELKREIQDQAYFVNFVSLARKLLPDGRRISSVRVSAVPNTQPVVYNLRSDLKRVFDDALKPQASGEAERLTATGILSEARRQKGNFGKIVLQVESGRKLPIDVPSGMLVDIVRPLFDERVLVTGYMKGKAIVLTDISHADSSLSEPSEPTKVKRSATPKDHPALDL